MLKRIALTIAATIITLNLTTGCQVKYQPFNGTVKAKEVTAYNHTKTKGIATFKHYKLKVENETKTDTWTVTKTTYEN